MGDDREKSEIHDPLEQVARITDTLEMIILTDINPESLEKARRSAVRQIQEIIFKHNLSVNDQDTRDIIDWLLSFQESNLFTKEDIDFFLTQIHGTEQFKLRQAQLLEEKKEKRKAKRQERWIKRTSIEIPEFLRAVGILGSSLDPLSQLKRLGKYFQSGKEEKPKIESIIYEELDREKRSKKLILDALTSTQFYRENPDIVRDLEDLSYYPQHICESKKQNKI